MLSRTTMSLGKLSLRPFKGLGPLKNTLSTAILSRSLRNQRVKVPLGSCSIGYTPARFSKAMEDKELIYKLQEEVDAEVRETDEKRTKLPKSVGGFLDKGPFKVEHSLGSDWIILTREFGNEKIKAEICLSDLKNATEDGYEDYADSESVDEEGEDSEYRTGSQDVKDEENGGEPAELEKDVLPCRITVTKADGGCLVFDTMVLGSSLSIDRVQHYKDANLALKDTPENDFKCAKIYGGPIYESLDDELKAKFSVYLEERGFDCAFAGFVPEFASFNEHEEYISWLKRVQDFVKK